MQLLIKIQEKKVQIVLLNSGKEVDKLEILEEHALSQQLLPKIDKILKRNKLEPGQVLSLGVESDQGDNFTTTRLAKTVAEMWNLGSKMNKIA